MKLWNLIRFRQGVQSKPSFAKTFIVDIYIDHPNVVGHVNHFKLTIDANSKQHALSRIHKEVKIKTGRPKEL